MISDRGFHLLELIVVMAIVAILAGIGFVLVRTTPARQAAIALASEIGAARLDALSGGMPTAVVLSSDSRSFERRAGTPWDDAASTCDGGSVTHRLELARFPRVAVATGFERGIVWFPAGWGRSCDGGGVYNGTVVLAGPRTSYAVVTSSAGRVRWEPVP